MEEDIQKQILEELRHQTVMFKKATRSSMIAIAFFLVLVVITMVLTPFIQRISRGPSTRTTRADSWHEVRSLWDQGESDEADKMLDRLIKKYPNYWYGYAILGSFHQGLGKFKEAEDAYAKAYDLFPSEENKKTLDAIRIVLRKNTTANK